MSTEAEALGERIAEMAAHLDAATHRLLTDLRDYDRSGNWSQQGFADCARWLSWRVGWATGTARDHLRVANRLGDLPLIDDALRTGAISYSKVRAMTRVATPANEAMLLEDARHATGQQLELICRKYATVVRAAKEVDEDYDRARRTVTRRDLEDGMVRIEATLHPEEAAAVFAALDRIALERCNDRSAERVSAESATGVAVDHTNGTSIAVQHIVSAQDTTANADVAPAASPSRRFSRADALVDLAHGVIRGDSPRRSPIELVVTVAADVLHGGAVIPAVSAETRDAPGHVVDSAAPPAAAFAAAPLAVFADGTCVSAETARRLACDCGIVHVTEDERGNPLTVGRKTRSIPVAIGRALLRRDACCRFPGCGNRVYVEGHHIEHWADGGETSLDNLVTMCGFHHRFVHEYGYSVVLDAKQRPQFFDSRGDEVLDVPDRPASQGLGWHALVAHNAPLEIDSRTNECLWDGDSPDYVDIIDALVRMDGLQ